jgi:urate oxidase
LKLWLELIASGLTETFPTVCSLVADNTLLSATEERLNALQKKFKKYFVSTVEDLDWVRDPFGAAGTSKFL